MASPTSIKEDFNRRLCAIPKFGLGLSVDVYSPDLFDLMGQLVRRDLRPAYLEIFKASTAALAAVRRHFPKMPLTYHGEGLWVTQPDFPTASSLEADLTEMVRHLCTLESCWINHECATKQMAGFSFGTYLPPLYNGVSAAVVADNVELVQRRLDEGAEDQAGPLFLLEMAPLTYFAAGTTEVPEFFRLVTERVSCGLVLDIGHLWTLYRYRGVGHETSLRQFVGKFLDEFPLERVVEIHVAGLAPHETTPVHEAQEILPAWIDSHAAPIPSVLWDVLEQVLAHPGLLNLRAIALEVDTKAIAMVIEEFDFVARRFGATICRKLAQGPPVTNGTSPMGEDRIDLPVPTETDRNQLAEEYARYAGIVSGQAEPTGREWQAVLKDDTELNRYIKEYLPHEILYWGGALTEMFPDSCRALAEQGVALEDFVAWWFKTPRRLDQPYDFFLVKIQRFLEFVAEAAPALYPVAEREARILRIAYAEANENVGTAPASEAVK